MTWQKVMAYAHQGIDLTPMPGVGNVPAPVLTEPPAPIEVPGIESALRPVTLSPRSAQRLVHLETLFKTAPAMPGALTAGGPASAPPASPTSGATGPGRQSFVPAVAGTATARAN